MSLSEKLETRKLEGKGFTNSIDRWLADLPAEERDAAMQMLRNPREWSQSSIRLAFFDEGFRVSEATISIWRRMNRVTS